MRRDLETIIIEPHYAAAVAASAYAIHSLGESSFQHPRKALTGPARPSGPSMRRPSGVMNNASGSARPVARIREDNQRPAGAVLKAQRIADAWEKAQLAKIRKRYERLYSAILSWENEKKIKAKRDMERRKNAMGLRGANVTQHYQSRIARIEHIANGARIQAEEKRKHEEFVIREKAKKISLTGQVPVTCFCF